MKKLIFILLLFPALAMAANPAPGQEKIGASCKTNADCNGGVCLDALDLNEMGCEGHVCTIVCQKRTDCPNISNEADGDCRLPSGIGKGGKQKLCMYGEWELKYCGGD